MNLKIWYENHKTFVYGIFSTGIMLAILVILADWIIMPLYTKHGFEEEVPDVIEMHFNQAKELLNSSGFQIIKQSDAYNETYAESTIIIQKPVPYSLTKKGRRVYVVLSKGEREVAVPNMIGRSERDAEFIIRQAGLVPGEIFYEYSNYYPNGVVSDQSIPAQDTVVEKTEIDLTISNGLRPDRFLVPNIIGKSLENAKHIIMKAGLNIGTIRYEVQKKLVPDTVLRQSLAPGEEVNQGTHINVTVSRLEDSEW